MKRRTQKGGDYLGLLTLSDRRAILSRMTDKGFTLGESELGGDDSLGGPTQPATLEGLRRRLVTHREALEAVLDRHVPDPSSALEIAPLITAHAAVVQALLALAPHLPPEVD